ncbi:phosphopentomutase [Buchnera aphidicola (Mindarus keteleerifoliae)]|uniref:phosphopentomutase n=1 Tax=Buchnera aphidicola TaxID=9 RepID=UPI0031B66F1D
MRRVFILLLDSLGIGSSKDSKLFGDDGSDTLGHIAEKCFLGKANQGRSGVLRIPNLTKLGLAESAYQATNRFPLGLNRNLPIISSYAYASQVSSGKDTISGHWEISGVPILFDWYYFRNKFESVSTDLVNQIIFDSNISGIIGNCHASGTDVLDIYGETHILTNKPIFYTSSDSVLQIACHENFFGLQKLYELCLKVRKILNNKKYKVARVIARPFLGEKKGSFFRTNNRKDFSIKPIDDTVMVKLIRENLGTVISIGKVSDIFSNVGISYSIKSNGIINSFNKIIKEIKKAKNNTIIFANFVDFDSLWGHRRDVSGYAKGLELFDQNLPKILEIITDKDLLIITADHGCDPTWKGSDHTRENIPILLYQKNKKSVFLGHRKTFSDIAQTIASFFSLSKMNYGKSMVSNELTF